MTYSEMKYEFLVKYDAIAGLQAPGYNDKEISVLLTAAQEILVKNRLVPEGNTYRDSFEETEKRKTEFANLIKGYESATFYSTNYSLENGMFVDLPSDYWLAIQERTDIKALIDDGCFDAGDILTDTWTKPITHDYYISNIENPFKQPYSELVWRITSGDNLGTGTYGAFELITGNNFVVDKYKLRYIRKPKPIIVAAKDGSGNTITIDGTNGPQSCELHSSIHREIIDKAVELAVEISKDTTRYQTLKLQNKFIE